MDKKTAVYICTGCGIGDEPGGSLLHEPLTVANTTLGVLAMRPEDPERFLLPEQRHLLESLVKQIALSLEGEYLAQSGGIVQPDFSDLKMHDGPDAVVER